MGQIVVEKKKKGRPSKADLASRRALESSATPAPPTSQREVRRSSRRRSFRYNIIEYDDDYLDDDEDELREEEEEEGEEDGEGDDDEDERGREKKKLKFVLRLNNSSNSRSRTSRNSARRLSRRGSGADSEEDDDEERREVKKRRIDEDDDDGGDENNGENDEEEDNDDEGRDGKGDWKRGDCAPGTPTDNTHSGTPLPDKKQLELVLDKLQKKDTYGVYAEPVDPEEIPDYHEVIEHPMDFSTVRKKLANGSYSTLEQFESDVYLISSNAMQYNSPETIYYKQARAIKELAEKKFQRIRTHIERWEKEPKSEPKCEPKSELKSEQKDRPSSVGKKQTKKPFCRSMQEPVGSDFSSGATLATTDAHNTCSADYVSNFDRPRNNDGPVEGISSLADDNTEKAEDQQTGKSALLKLGRKSFVVDENRRASYNISIQPVDRSESLFTTFEGEEKQLIPVGLHGEYSYARSMARFAANLGPLAWRMASKRIEQLLPPGIKYGRGWIGEYEPLPTSVLVLESRKEYPFVSMPHSAADPGKNNELLGSPAPANQHMLNQPCSDGKLTPIFSSQGAKPTMSSVFVSQQQNPTISVYQQQKPTVSISQNQGPLPKGSGGPENMMVKRVGLNCLSANNQKNGTVLPEQNQIPRELQCPDNMCAKKAEANSPSISHQKSEYVAQKQPDDSIDMGAKSLEPSSPSISNKKTDNVAQRQPAVSRPLEPIPKGRSFLQSLPFKQPDANGGGPEGLHNGKMINNFVDNNRVIAPSPGLIPTQLAGAAPSFPHRQDQGLSDPVLVMKMLTEKAQRQQKGTLHAHSPSPAMTSVPSPRGDSGNNAAAVAASAWMSVGSIGFKQAAQNPAINTSQASTDSLYNGTRVFYPQAMQSRVEYPMSARMHLQPERKGLPFQTFVPHPMKVGNEAQVQNSQMVFPHLVTNDLSRFQSQATWQGLSPLAQQKQKQDTLPPDLNVAFQSSVDSQQPDLALQL